MLFRAAPLTAQEPIEVNAKTFLPASGERSPSRLASLITNPGYGGPTLKFTRFNNQLAIMTGGRGSCILNHRITVGGGGYGIANQIWIDNPDGVANRYLKIGYGGPEVGYILLPGKSITIGTSLLMAAGAVFLQSKPKIEGDGMFDDGFRIFPVLEPALYGEVALGRIIRLHAGVTYRYVTGAGNRYIGDRQLRDFSAYAGVLLGQF
ncbi:MAG: hypothetical protein WC699_10465 [Bacteroidales bacterium]|jgi:hypothetical protein